MKSYSIEVFRKDGRVKEGQRLVAKFDVTANSEEQARKEAVNVLTFERDWSRNDFNKMSQLAVYETYRKVTNLMSGKTVMERYDTPRSCSVGSELYWSM